VTHPPRPGPGAAWAPSLGSGCGVPSGRPAICRLGQPKTPHHPPTRTPGPGDRRDPVLGDRRVTYLLGPAWPSVGAAPGLHAEGVRTAGLSALRHAAARVLERGEAAWAGLLISTVSVLAAVLTPPPHPDTTRPGRAGQDPSHPHSAAPAQRPALRLVISPAPDPAPVPVPLSVPGLVAVAGGALGALAGGAIGTVLGHRGTPGPTEGSPDARPDR